MLIHEAFEERITEEVVRVNEHKKPLCKYEFLLLLDALTPVEEVEINSEQCEIGNYEVLRDGFDFVLDGGKLRGDFGGILDLTVELKQYREQIRLHYVRGLVSLIG